MASRWLAAAERIIAARGGEIHYVLAVALRVAWCTIEAYSADGR